MDNDIKVSTVQRHHQSQSLNYGKVTQIDFYVVVRCPKCDSEKDVTTASIIDGEVDRAVGTILEPKILLYSARCKNCLWEKYF